MGGGDQRRAACPARRGGVTGRVRTGTGRLRPDPGVGAEGSAGPHPAYRALRHPRDPALVARRPRPWPRRTADEAARRHRAGGDLGAHRPRSGVPPVGRRPTGFGASPRCCPRAAPDQAPPASAVRARRRQRSARRRPRARRARCRPGAEAAGHPAPGTAGPARYEPSSQTAAARLPRAPARRLDRPLPSDPPGPEPVFAGRSSPTAAARPTISTPPVSTSGSRLTASARSPRATTHARPHPAAA